MKMEKTRMNIRYILIYCLAPVCTQGFSHTLYACCPYAIEIVWVTLLWVTTNTIPPHIYPAHPAWASTPCTKLPPHSTALLTPQGCAACCALLRVHSLHFIQAPLSHNRPCIPPTPRPCGPGWFKKWNLDCGSLHK